MARCFAQCSGAADDPEVKKGYAETAIAALAAAIAQGYRDAVYLESEPDLDPVRGREDFKSLIVQASSTAEQQVKP